MPLGYLPAVFKFAIALRHTAVCHVTQENGVCTNRVSILPGRTKLRFSHKCNSMISNPNGTIFTMEDAIFQIKVNPFSHSQDTSKLLKKFFVCSSFHTLNKNRCNLQILTPNWLKFITPFGGPRVNLSINF